MLGKADFAGTLQVQLHCQLANTIRFRLAHHLGSALPTLPVRTIAAIAGTARSGASIAIVNMPAIRSVVRARLINLYESTSGLPTRQTLGSVGKIHDVDADVHGMACAMAPPTPCLPGVIEDADHHVGLGLGRASSSHVFPHHAQRSLVQHIQWDSSCHLAVRLSCTSRRPKVLPLRGTLRRTFNFQLSTQKILSRR